MPAYQTGAPAQENFEGLLICINAGEDKTGMANLICSGLCVPFGAGKRQIGASVL